jgi:hypothetical protein
MDIGGRSSDVEHQLSVTGGEVGRGRPIISLTNIEDDLLSGKFTDQAVGWRAMSAA